MERILIYRKGLSGDIQSNNPTSFLITKAELVQELMTTDKVDVVIKANEPITFYINDYILVGGRAYFLNQNPIVKKSNSFNYEYTLQFEGAQYDLLKRTFLNVDSQGIYTSPDFSFTGQLKDFIDLIVRNANRGSNIVWSRNITDTNIETKTITFNNFNSLSALQAICQEFGTEFNIKQDLTANKNVLTIGKLETSDIRYTMSYGFNNGLYSLERNNTSEGQITSKLFVFGSSDNLKSGYRNNSARLKMPASVGDYIQDQSVVDLYGLSEEVLILDDIKPTFTGKIKSIVNTSSLNSNLFEFVCDEVNFDLNETDENGNTKYLISGTPASISVKSGNLAGYEFEIHSYLHSEKRFLVKKIKDERGQYFPDANTTAFVFNENDEFTLFNIVMPDAIVEIAEQKLYEKGLEEYAKKSKINTSYKLSIDGDFLSQYGEDTVQLIEIGDLIKVEDTPLNVSKTSRVISLSKNLLLPYKYTAEIADTFNLSITQQVVQELNNVRNETATQQVVNRELTLRNYQRARELQELVFDADGYFDSESIRPNSIETNMLSVGARSQQFNLENCQVITNYNSNVNLVSLSATELVHFNLGDSVVEWTIPAKVVTLKLSQAYYFYAKVKIGSLTGEWLATTDKIKFDSEAGYYIFLCGIVHAPSNGVRLKDFTYGTSFIQGREVTTGRIQSVNKNTYFDLDTGEISGKITFSNDSPALSQIDERIKDIFGDDSLTLYIESSKGDLLDLDDLNTTLTPYVDRYFNDVTEEVTSWQWTRESGITQEDIDADMIWAMDKQNRILNLTAEDFTHNIFEHGVTFICVAHIENVTLRAEIRI